MTTKIKDDELLSKINSTKAQLKDLAKELADLNIKYHKVI